MNFRTKFIAVAAAIIAATGLAWATQTINDAVVINGTITQTNGVNSFGGATTFTGSVTPTGGVAAGGGFTLSPRNMACGSQVPHVSTEYTNSTPTITEVQICEVQVPANVTATGVWYFTGTASSGGGNVKVGLANSAGAVLATSASTAGGSNDSIQLVPFTATIALVGPATYYILSIYDTATAGFYNAPPLGAYGCAVQTGQVYATGFTTITPPTTFTANKCNVGGLY